VNGQEGQAILSWFIRLLRAHLKWKRIFHPSPDRWGRQGEKQ